MYHKWESYDVWFLKYGACDRQDFLSFWTVFLPFYPPTNPNNQNFENMKKRSVDISILHKCTINNNHMMYGSWGMKHDGQNFLLFWTIFCSFTPPNNPKNQNFEKMKKTPGGIIIYICIPKIMIRRCWFLRYAAWQTDGPGMEKVIYRGGSPT